MGMGEAMVWRWRSEGEDGNRAVAVLKFIDSDNEIYLMILNK
jgi:hypothetical protein